jgi:hypothetical protein
MGPEERRVSFNRERFMATTYGHRTSEWESARDWVTKRLYRVARDRATITYGDLCDEMARAGGLRLDPRITALAGLLGQVNLLEHEAGRPLISALVVHQGGGRQPGEGFWSFARDLGVDPGVGSQARLDFWVREVQRCQSYWTATRSNVSSRSWP